MRLSSRYEDLMNCLGDVSSVVEDSFSTEDMKSVIFKFVKGDPNEVYMIGINRVITFKTRLLSEVCKVDLEDSELDSNGVLLISLKCREFKGFLDSYKGLRKTRVDEVVLETTDRGKIKCTMIERNVFSEDEMANLMYLENGDELLNKQITSQWVFDSLKIPANLDKNINLKAPETELIPLQKEMIQLHTQNLLPIMQNSTNTYSNLLFDDENVVAFNQAYTTIMKNRIADGGVFSGIMLSYRAVSYLDKLVADEDIVEVARTESHIYVKTMTSETFITYTTKLAVYKTVSELFKKDNVVTLDRIYLKDVLKRLSLLNDSVEVSIKPQENLVTLSNSKFSQNIELNYMRGFTDVIRFKIMPEVMNKAIIGADDKFVMDGEYGGDVFIYYCVSNNVSVIVFSDATGGWYSVVKVKIY